MELEYPPLEREQLVEAYEEELRLRKMLSLAFDLIIMVSILYRARFGINIYPFGLFCLLIVVGIFECLTLNARRYADKALKRLNALAVQGEHKRRVRFEADQMIYERIPEGDISHFAYGIFKKMILTPNLYLLYTLDNLMIVIPRESPCDDETSDPVAEFMKQKCPRLKVVDKR